MNPVGFVYKKAKLVPDNPDAEKQKEFIENYSQLRENLPADEKIIFPDGVHPTHNVKSTYGWIKAESNKQVMSNTGRWLNINGAFNPRTLEIICRNEKAINAKSTGMLIVDILDKYPRAKKIHIISLLSACENLLLFFGYLYWESKVAEGGFLRSSEAVFLHCPNKYYFNYFFAV